MKRMSNSFRDCWCKICTFVKSLPVQRIRDCCRRFYAFYQTTPGQWICSLLFAALSIGLVHTLRPVFFGTNDDVGIMNTFRGSYYVEPQPYHQFTSLIVGTVISSLYKAIPSIHWYPLYCIFILLASITVLYRCVVCVCRWRRLPLYISSIINLVLFIAFFAYPICAMQFTYLATILGTASVALVIPAALCDSGRSRIFDIALSIVLFLFGSLVRYSAMTSYACFWVAAIVLTALIVCVRDRTQLKAVVLCVCLIVPATLGAAYGLNTVSSGYRTEAESAEYLEFNSYRIKYMDYDHVSYDEDPEFFDSIGWTYYTARIIDKWYFLDPAFNTENLKKIVEYDPNWRSLDGISVSDAPISATDTVSATASPTDVSAADTASAAATESGSSSSELIGKLWERWMRGGILRCMAPVLLLLGCCCLYLLCWRLLHQREWKEYLGAALISFVAAGGFIAQCGYLIYVGRFVFRGYYCAILCAALLLVESLLLLAPERFSDLEPKSIGRKSAFVALLTVGITLGAISLGLGLYMNFSPENYGITMERNAARDTAEQYAIEHPELVFFRDESLTADSRINSVNDKPYTLLLWGGSTFYSKGYYSMLERIGKDKLTTDTLFDDDVFLLTNIDYARYEKLLFGAYLEERYGEITFNRIESLDHGVYVYKITRAGDAPVSDTDLAAVAGQ